MANIKGFEIGNEVVRSKGDYVVGRIGVIIELDEINERARVDWKGNPKTWVKYDVIEKTEIPYEIKPGKRWSQYFRK